MSMTPAKDPVAGTSSAPLRTPDSLGGRKRRRDTSVRGGAGEVERPRKRAMPAPSKLRQQQAEERRRRQAQEQRAQEARLAAERKRLAAERREAAKRRKNEERRREREWEKERANVRRRSDRSVDMSESEGSVPPAASKYPIEGKFKSEKDREEILALPEIQRESILADRADEMQKEDESRRLKALFQSYKDTSKRKADEADLRETSKSSRVKTQNKQRLDELRRKREERDVKRTGQTSRPRRSSASPDAEADGESEPEFDSGGRRDRTPEEKPITLRDFELIKVNYNNLAKVCFYPHFDTTMVGCYVRLPYGSDPSRKQYRMARIEEVVERHPYATASGNGRKFITTQHLVVSMGKSRRDVPFIFCSQGAFTEQELEYYLSKLREENLPVPKRSHLINKNADIIALIGHNFTDKELSAKVNMSNVLQQRYREHKRSMLEREKERAERNEEFASAERVSRQLETVMTDALNLRYDTSMPQSSSAGAGAGRPGSVNNSPNKKPSLPAQQTQQQRLAQMNRDRAKDDQQRIRKALLEEKRVAANRHKAALAAAAAAARNTPDPTTNAAAAAAAAAAVAAEAGDSSAQTTAATNTATSKDDGPKKAVKMVNGKPVHNRFSADDDLELPRPEWCFNYVEYSNKYLGSRSMRHLTYDEKGRAITEWPREMTEDEALARLDIPGMPTPEY